MLENILAIDSSSNNLRLALTFGGDRFVKSEETVEQSHGQVIIKKIDELIQSAGLQKTDINAIIVSSGPGSFTGLRIGIAAAKGIAVALEIGIISVNLFELAAYKLQSVENRVQIIIPFKKDEFFIVPVADGTYDMRQLKTCKLPQLEDICQNSLFAAFGISIQDIYPDAFDNDYSDRMIYDAADLIHVASSKIEKKEYDNLSDLEPLYIQKSQAEINFERRNKQ